MRKGKTILIEHVSRIAKHEAVYDSVDINLHKDLQSVTIDEAYSIGVRDGEISMARHVLAMLQMMGRGKDGKN